jgi:hypothetical protein
MMSSLVSFVLVAVLAFSPALAAENAKGNTPSQNPPAVPTDSKQVQSGASETQQPVTKQKKPNVKKVKKSSCVSPPADSGLPDYCKNPYWEPKDWNYIMMNGCCDGSQ